MRTFSIHFNKKEDMLIRKYVELHNLDLSTFIRETLIEKIEDEFDLTLFNKVWEEEQAETHIAHNQVKKELDL